MSLTIIEVNESCVTTHILFENVSATCFHSWCPSQVDVDSLDIVGAFLYVSRTMSSNNSVLVDVILTNCYM